MFLERKEEGQLHKESILVGYDLGEDYSQISYGTYGSEEVETIATVAGTKQFSIPTVLCKRKGVNQWFYGKDAVKNFDQEDMIPIEGLLALARKGEKVELDGEEFDPAALLTLFMKRSLSLLNFITAIENIGAIMFTVDELDDSMVEVLAKAAVNLNLKTSKIYFQSHTESFYHYMIHQQPELWGYQVLACEHDGRRLKTYRMECNKRTTPIVVLIEEQRYDSLPIPDENEDEAIRADACKTADERFLDILQRQCEGRIVSSAYLLGDGFRTGWDEKSLQFLCRGRRVFQGNNLFSRGACYALRDKFEPAENARTHVYLGKDKLKSNVGMYVYKRGEQSYLALLDAGENWYEIRKECEFLLEGEKEIDLVITPLNGKNQEVRKLPFGNGAAGEAPFTRYHMEMSMVSPEKVRMSLTELGFGDLFPGTGQSWEEIIEVS